MTHFCFIESDSDVISHHYSAQIDLAFEKIVNCFFYFFLSVCAVSILGIDLWTVSLATRRDGLDMMIYFT